MPRTKVFRQNAGCRSGTSGAFIVRESRVRWGVRYARKLIELA